MVWRYRYNINIAHEWISLCFSFGAYFQLVVINILFMDIFWIPKSTSSRLWRIVKIGLKWSSYMLWNRTEKTVFRNSKNCQWSSWGWWFSLRNSRYSHSPISNQEEKFCKWWSKEWPSFTVTYFYLTFPSFFQNFHCCCRCSRLFYMPIILIYLLQF